MEAGSRGHALKHLIDTGSDYLAAFIFASCPAMLVVLLFAEKGAKIPGWVASAFVAVGVLVGAALKRNVGGGVLRTYALAFATSVLSSYLIYRYSVRIDGVSASASIFFLLAGQVLSVSAVDISSAEPVVRPGSVN
jgi:hypothetical protein